MNNTLRPLSEYHQPTHGLVLVKLEFLDEIDMWTVASTDHTCKWCVFVPCELIENGKDISEHLSEKWIVGWKEIE